ncbi:4-carboxy-4-hydroxy-2-oxoadipate aldolase/oxaloacetate decarboxylase [Micromonospora sp. WMMD1102]|uniref:4-carboxy-4-hydroxy-2-oxoadipate aldolase/oxaloacetate decarboxylase n=1 Tax=Micromonospora sp. WMMD1102 TaxID=3016105 RepID=UPI002414DA1E|nr:4-carboxy-4-hydroxy-2-oxoadipate aldolase/oxaloacetate decarboxylase [Micromonospora sp. WMMD1102]MDG4787637.1 4-carboxy-4-hydroxy-2-oxoadipate aldolase/oxaloacetate decarboxylase [Micromonospora sp. WMMD1102]
MTGHVIVRTDVGPPADAVALLARQGVSTVHEAQGRTGLLGHLLRPIYPGARIAGRAVTVSAQPGDNLMIHAAVEQTRPGDVLVVGFTSPSTDGAFGELLATSLRARGVLGLVIDAGCRDVAALTRMGFPVWSRAVCAQGTVKASPGSVNVPVVLGGAYLRPGDVVVADDDGVVVVPRERAREVAAAGVEREAAEEEKRRLLADGVLGLDMYQLRPLLAQLGVRYVDAPETANPTDAPPNPTATAETPETPDGTGTTGAPDQGDASTPER